MIDLVRRQALVSESLYGNEALRGELGDEAARVLFDWLQECVPSIVQTTAAILDDEDADELMYPRLKAMRKLAKQVNALATRGPDMDQETQRRTLAKIEKYAAVLYDTEPPVRSRSLAEADPYEHVLTQLPELLQSPEQLITTLREIFEPKHPAVRLCHQVLLTS